MSSVKFLLIEESDADQRFDRWFKKRFPHIGQSHLQRMLRKGQIRVDGSRIKASHRLNIYELVRIPPIQEMPANSHQPREKISSADRDFINSLVIHRDSNMIVLNKPSGLAVQGGSKQQQHLDRLSTALVGDEEEPPKLVHRLDAETSGIMILARNQSAAAELGKIFRARQMHKIYWAMVHNVPNKPEGTIRSVIGKKKTKHGERMVTNSDGGANKKTGKSAITRYRLLDTMGKRFSWLELSPLTGRKHQLRVHMQNLGSAIVGDNKYCVDYADNSAAVSGENSLQNSLSDRLHLHAVSLSFANPFVGGKPISFVASLDEELKRDWNLMGWNADYIKTYKAPAI